MINKNQENTPEKKVPCPNGHYIKAFNTKAKK